MSLPESACLIARGVESGEFRAEEILDRSLRRIEASRALGAIVQDTGESARESARRLDAARREGASLGPLAGVPLAVKDNICTRRAPTTCASALLASYTPPYDATAVARLDGAGALLAGKTNCDEFGMGSSNENSVYGPVRNPWDEARVAGGSSGGSAAAVAAGLVPLALGSDTGGSIRQPAAFCGVVGLKPTHGRISRRGLVAFGSSFDQIGPITRNARDAALALRVLAGFDPGDASSARRAVPDYPGEIDLGVEGLRVGVLREMAGGEGISPRVEEAVLAASAALEEEGAKLVDTDLPLARYGIPIYYLLANAEASSNLSRFDGVRYGRRREGDGSLQGMYEATRGEGFGREVKRRIILGTFSLSAGYREAYYDRAQRARALLRRQMDRALETADLLLLPTTPGPAFRLGEMTGDPLRMYLQDVFTVLASVGGHPAISVPAPSAGSEKLPVGVQMIGRHFEESILLRGARALEDHGFRWETP